MVKTIKVKPREATYKFLFVVHIKWWDVELLFGVGGRQSKKKSPFYHRKHSSKIHIIGMTEWLCENPNLPITQRPPNNGKIFLERKQNIKTKSFISCVAY